MYTIGVAAVSWGCCWSIDPGAHYGAGIAAGLCRYIATEVHNVRGYECKDIYSSRPRRLQPKRVPLGDGPTTSNKPRVNTSPQTRNYCT